MQVTSSVRPPRSLTDSGLKTPPTCCQNTPIVEITTGQDSELNHLNLKAPIGLTIVIFKVIIRIKVTVFIQRAASP